MFRPGVVKNALRVVAKPRWGVAPASFGTSRKAFLTHNAPWQKQCQQTLTKLQADHHENAPIAGAANRACPNEQRSD